MNKSKAIITGLLGIVFLVLLGTGASAQYPTPTTGSTTSTTTGGTTPVDVQAGTDFTASGSGCAANSPVYIVLDGSLTPPASLPPASYTVMTTADASGNFVAVVHIPATTSTGLHNIVAYCNPPAGVQGIVVQNIPINVLAASTASTTSSAPLARTGAPSHLGSLIGIGAAALVLGLSFLYGATRRPKRAGGNA